MIITEQSLLLKECKDVSLFEAGDIIKKLEHELQNAKDPGIGLAANQIGINAKVCIIRIPGKQKINLINPKIEKKYDLMEFYNEGCLSFPNIFITTKRFNEIVISDILFPAGIVMTGVESVVAQHEIGHLYGETMLDYKITIPFKNKYCWCDSKKKYKVCHLGKVIR